MTFARRGTLLVLLGVLIAGAALGFAEMRSRSSPLAERPKAERPTLLLLTGLPLLFNEDFSLSGGGSPALKRLQSRYRVVPISVTSIARLGVVKLATV